MSRPPHFVSLIKISQWAEKKCDFTKDLNTDAITYSSTYKNTIYKLRCQLEIRDARPAPTRPAPRKNGPPRPAPQKASLAPPHPALQKLTKPAGRSGEKLTIDYTDYAHTFGLRVGKWSNSFSFGLLYSLWLSGLQEDHLKSENVIL